MTTATGLDLLTIPEKVVEMHGRRWKITPVRVGRLAEFAAAANPLMDKLAAAIDGEGDLIEIISNNASSMIEVVSVGAGIPRDEVDDMLADEFIAVAAAVVTVNASFFISRLQAVLPKMGRLMQAVQKKLADAGLTASKP